MSKRLLWSSILLLAVALPAMAAEADKSADSSGAAASGPPKPSAPAMNGKGEKSDAKATAKPAPKVPQRDVEKFPAPLEFISSNITKLEKSGYFHVERVEFGRNEDFDDEAFVWTIKVERPLTCRMAMDLLNQCRDVRFYDTIRGNRFELLAALMYYSSRLSDRAVSNEILGRDEVLQLWVTLSIEDRRMLKSQGADLAEFGRMEKRPPSK
jgi:hypothetical protein